MLPNSAGSVLLRLRPICSVGARALSEQTPPKPGSAVAKAMKQIEEDKEILRWQPPIAENPNVWQSKFKLFGNEEQTSDFLTMMQKPIDLSPKAIKNWWTKRKLYMEEQMQQYIPERHGILGADLATAHFLVHRGGSVKFLGHDEWTKADKDGEYDLPGRYDPGWKVERIRCNGMRLYYEGVENIRSLQHLKSCSFRDVKTFDDWCLDRFSGMLNKNLEVLDLRGTSITLRGLSAIYRMEKLKLLLLDDPAATPELELTCALVEASMPQLSIRSSAGPEEVNL